MENRLTQNELDKGQIVNLEDPFADEVGFTRDRFDGYLWRIGQVVYISLVVSKQPGEGHLSALFEALSSRGYTVRVPTPLAKMEAILRGKGFEEKREWWEEIEDYGTVWEKPPPCFVGVEVVIGERCEI